MQKPGLTLLAMVLFGCGGSAGFDASGADSLAAVDSELRGATGVKSVLIGFREGRAFNRARVLVHGASVGREWEQVGVLSAEIEGEAIGELAREGDIEFIEANRPVRASAFSPFLAAARLAPVTNFNRQGSVNEYTWGLKAVQAPRVWDADSDGRIDSGAAVGSGIKVCVVDSGIDRGHPELRIPFQGGIDLVDNDSDPTDPPGGTGHGTHVSGTIAAQLGAGGATAPGLEASGVVGVAPGVALYMARMLDTAGEGTSSGLISAVLWCAANGAHVVNMSLGAPSPTRAERRAFELAGRLGVLMFASNGNDGNDVEISYPAGYSDVIAVGALDENKVIADFSQTGAEAELTAPGVSILSSVPRGSGRWPSVAVGTATFSSHAVEFTGTGRVSAAVVNCGLSDTATSCGSVSPGFVAYVDRGQIDFSTKVQNATAQGAAAVIIGNNDAAHPDDAGAFTLGEPGDWVPVASVSFNSASGIKSRLGQAGEVRIWAVDYANFDGTSMASPHAAGVGALVWSKRPSLSRDRLRALLRRSALDLGPSGWDKSYGYGLVQAKAALDAP